MGRNGTDVSGRLFVCLELWHLTHLTLECNVDSINAVVQVTMTTAIKHSPTRLRLWKMGFSEAGVHFLTVFPGQLTHFLRLPANVLSSEEVPQCPRTDGVTFSCTCSTDLCSYRRGTLPYYTVLKLAIHACVHLPHGVASNSEGAGLSL